jgi:ABC-type multidrug transport system fused ATPase/permease subunit
LCARLDRGAAAPVPTDPGLEELHVDGSPESIAWRRVLSLLRPLKAGLAAMVGLSVLGSLAGLVPPITVGFLINDLVEKRGVKPEDVLWAALLAGAIVVEAAAYIGSDGLYARNAGRLYRNLRLSMFDSVMRRPAAERADAEGLPSRFISDVETFERVTVYALDTGSMLIVELGTALVVLGLMEPWAIAVVAPLLAVTWLVTRRMQEPAARAGQERQEQLEELTGTLSRELAGSRGSRGRSRFSIVAERLLRAEVRLGWVQAANLHLSGALAKLGPIAVVVTAALVGGYRVGTLLTLYLLAARAFYGFDGLVDLSLAMQSVRGAIARCLELIPPSRPTAEAPASGIAA